MIVLFKRFWKENKYILLTISIACFIIFGIFIFSDRPFLVNADQQLQYNIFYEEWIRLIKEFIKGNGLPFYSWNSFLGADFFSSGAYYYTGDIFLPLILLIRNIPLALFVETILCVYISALLMNLYLKEFGIKRRMSRNAMAIIYALSGWAMLFYGQYMFHRFYAFLPLLFYGIESYYQNGKKSMFIIATTILLLQSYYLFFPVVIFLPIYCLFSKYDKQRTFKGLTFDILNLVFSFFVGFLISSIVVIPALLYVFSNPRLGTVSDTSLFWNINTYFGFILNLITSPFPVYTDFPNLFYAGTNGHEYWYSLFVGIIPLVLSIKCIAGKNNRHFLYVSIFLITGLIFKPFTSILHGFSDPSLRWTFLIILFTLLCAAKQLDQDEYKKENKIFCSYFTIATLVTILCLLFVGGFMEYYEHYINILFSICCAAFIYYVFVKSEKAGIVLSIFQMIVCAAFLIYTYNSNYYLYTESINSEYVSYFSDIDEDLMYRQYIDSKLLLPTSDLNLNKSLQFGYMSTQSYHTLYDTNIYPFLNKNGIYWHIIDLDNPSVWSMLGVKYVVVYDESELPNVEEYEYVYNLNHLKVYRRKNFNSFGYSASNLDYFDNIKDLNQFDSTIFIDDPSFDINKYKHLIQSKIQVYDRGNNYLKATINSDTQNIAFLPIPNNAGWKLIINGEEVKSISVNGGFLGFEIMEGYNDIQIYFVSPGFKLGLIMSCFGFILLILVVFMERRNVNEK